MSDKLGPIVYGSEHSSDEVFLGRDFNSSRDYSEKTANDIDEEIRRIVETAYAEAMRILNENMDKLHFIAEYLMKNEIMDGAQFEAVMTGNPTMEDLDAMVAEKRRISEEENRRKAQAEAEARKRDEEESKLRDQLIEEQKKKAETNRPLSPMEQYAKRLEEEQRQQQQKENDEANQDASDDDSNDNK